VLGDNTRRDIVIVGAGPAGLTAAMYCSRMGRRVLVVDKAAAGGKAASTDLIENYPGFPQGITGADLMQRMRDQAFRWDAEFQNWEVTNVRQVPEGFRLSGKTSAMTCRAVIWCAGTRERRLGVRGEERLTGRGVSYCATCDGPLYRGRRVAVIGGGDSAIAGALFLSRLATKVWVVHRRQQLRATKVLQERARQCDNLEIVWNSVVTEIVGEDRVRAIALKNLETGHSQLLEVDGVFVYIGSVPNTEPLRGVARLDEGGYVVTNETLETSCPGLFAAGDVRRTPLRQVVTAVGDGAIAAMSAEHFLASQE